MEADVAAGRERVVADDAVRDKPVRPEVYCADVPVAGVAAEDRQVGDDGPGVGYA